MVVVGKEERGANQTACGDRVLLVATRVPATHQMPPWLRR
ncbi:hypothetical protein SPRI_0385 [Streptomyces pristinaespiralis]|uniref:Uncharacterized protein n=1 Tax=Streptomyces pristinaespiralis TaxID=38300 RepID=A0A0M4D0E9_STRPR|nr:hypothetical protein SPRI_0385 [Streptomyces pristinaespiralis]